MHLYNGWNGKFDSIEGVSFIDDTHHISFINVWNDLLFRCSYSKLGNAIYLFATRFKEDWWEKPQQFMDDGAESIFGIFHNFFLFR